MRRSRELRGSKGSTKISVQVHESTSHGRGCFTGGLVKEKRSREFIVKKEKKRNSQGGDLSTPTTNSQGEDRRIFKHPAASSEKAKGIEVEGKESNKRRKR